MAAFRRFDVKERRPSETVSEKGLPLPYHGSLVYYISTRRKENVRFREKYAMHGG